ncbi:hypothetical protein Tco_0105368 [Tanacetum coccineum]
MVVLMLCYFIRIMDPTSSLGRIFLGENVYGSPSEKVEGHGDWDALEYTDTAGSKEKNVTKALSFYKMETDEVSERYIAPCFVNGLDAYDGEINLALDENLISNEFAVKLCLDYEVKKGNKVVKKELIVALRGELNFVKFIINLKEDDVEPGDPFVDDYEKTKKSMDDWDQLLDFNFDDIPKLDGEELQPFVCKMGKSSRNKKRVIENLNLFYQDIGTSSSTGRHLTQEEAAKEALALKINQRFALLEEMRPVLETMAYNDKYKKVLDEIWKDKVELDGMVTEEEEKAIIKVKGEALKEEDDLGAFIFSIRFDGKVNENALADTGSDINTMPYRIYEKLGREEIKKGQQKDHNEIGGIVNTPERLFSTIDGICHQTFHVARSDVLKTAESDSDDEEEYEIKRNQFGAPMYGLKPTSYLNSLQAVINPFRKISVWKKAVSFLGSLPVLLQHVDWKPDYKGCYTNEEEAKGQWRTEIRLTDPHGNIYTMGTHDHETGSSRTKRSRQYETVEEVLLPRVHHEFLEWEGCNTDAKSRMGCDREIDEIFTSVAWIRAFNINEPIYSELCHEFYSTYEFDEVCANDELLGLYHDEELDEEGFDVYFQGGLRSDEHFNAQEYWLSISREENLGLSRSHTSNIWNPVLRVIHKMITYGLCQRTTRCNKIQKNDSGLLSMFDARHQNRQFITKLARKARVLSDEVLRSLSSSVYCKYLDTTTLRELIDSEGRLNPEDLQPDVPRVAIPRAQRASM